MKLLSRFAVKHFYRVIVLCLTLLLFNSTVRAQCEADLYLSSDPYILCSPQTVTFTTELNYWGPKATTSGVINWYNQETGGQPFASQVISTNDYDIYINQDVYATNGKTIWVSYYDNWTGCETDRVPYTFEVIESTPPPTLVEEYGFLCGTVAKIKINSSNNPSGLYTLYKQNQSGNFDFVNQNTTGYFEIANYDPNSVYAVSGGQTSVCTSPSYYYAYITNTFPLDAPSVSGNFSIVSGSSTAINATSDNFSDFRWYNSANTLVGTGASYTTPVLTARADYHVEGFYNEGPGCTSNATWVTVSVTEPPPPPVCNNEMQVTMTDPVVICSPQQATITATMNNPADNGVFSGSIKWYNTETGGQPYQEDLISSSSDPELSSSTSINANDGTTVWVTYYNSYTQCEAPRIPYTVSITPMPAWSITYAHACGTVGKLKLNSSSSTLTYYLYKETSGNVYSLMDYNTTGYFEVASYDPNGLYFVSAANSNGCFTDMGQIGFEAFDPSAPTVTGNTTLLPGNSTTLTASGNEYYYKWVDSKGNLLTDQSVYTTPVLTENSYTYQVSAYSEDEVCVSNPATVIVSVNFPSITYTPVYDNGNFIKTVDLSKPVGTVRGEAGTTPEGAVTYSIPIFASPGTNGVLPSISLGYSSMAGNGVAGYGWNLTGLSVISRTGKNNFHDGVVTPITYTDQDVFILDGNRLTPVSGLNGADQTLYAGETETFAQIKSIGSNSTNPDWFQVINKDGSVLEYGRTTDARFLTDDGANVIFWRLNRVIDVSGNYVEFKYRDGFRDNRIDEINYTGNDNASLVPYNKIKFNYDVRADEVATYIAGASFTNKHLISSITVTSDGNVVKAYQFNYGYDNMYSLLNEVTETGSDGTSLNSTIFQYSAHQLGMTVSAAEVLDGSYDYFTGDFNGDGKSDLLAAQQYYVDGIKYHNKFVLCDDIAKGTTHTLYTKQLVEGYRVYGGGLPYGNFLVGDYNGDGRDDVVEVNTQHVVGRGFSPYDQLNLVRINLTKQDPTTNETVYTEQEFNYVLSASDYRIIEPTNGSFFVSGDFDGDGNQDFITIRGKPLSTDFSNNLYKAFFTSPSTGSFDKEITFVGAGIDENYLNSIAAGNFTSFDADGDGKEEILVSTVWGSTVFAIQSSGSGSNLSFTATPLFSTGQIVRSSPVYPGDFNGDGKTDLLVRYNGWEILYSTGTSFLTTYFPFNRNVNITGADTDDKLVVSDFNGDGKSDILHGYSINSTFSQFSLYYVKGDINNSFINEVYDYAGALAKGTLGFTTGDFNGDGKNDMLNRANSSTIANYIAFDPMGKERLLTKVTNGHNITNTFEYRALTDKDNTPVVYDRTISLDDPANGNGFNYVQLPMYVVSSFSSPDGIGGVSTTRYHYQDAVVHRLAKGFLGFKKIVTENSTAGIRSTTENEINTTFAAPYQLRQTSELTNNTLVSVSSTNISFIGLPVGSANPKRFTLHQDGSQQFNYLTGVGSEQDNIYDDYGNVTSSTVKTGGFSGTAITPTNTVTTTSVFGTFNTPVPARVTSTTVKQERSGMSVQSKVTAFTYTTNGLPATKTEFSGTPKAVTSTYTYDQFGNMATTTVSATGLNSRVAALTYDAKGRLPETKQQIGSGVTQTETTTFDYRWGSPLTKTSTDYLTSTFEYDGFGRLKKTTLPAGYTITTTMNWDVQGENVYYTLADYSNNGKADVKTWYDKLGRPTKTQSAGFNNQWIKQVTTYDVKGNIFTKTNPYYDVETPIVTTSTYDDYNRVLSSSNSLGTVNYTYTSLGGGKQQFTSTSASQTTSKITDASGKVVTATDKGGQLDFTYDSWGNRTQVVHGADVVLENHYDSYGRQTSTIDKNTGTVTYDYDAFGQLKQQTDNNGNTYTMLYDDFGRIISRQGPEGTTSYEYYKDINTGCSNDNLSKVTGFNGIVDNYTFDALKRIQSKTTTIDGTSYSTSYEYDAYGNVTKITYPSGVEVNNTYDNNGNLLTVTGGDNGNPTTLFTGTGMNGLGRYTAYTLGNNKSTQNTYTNGFPTRFYTAGIQDLNFNFDYSKGNLTSRRDGIKNVTETFGYDDLNRLTSATVNNVTQLSIGYDGNSTFSRGNITQKSDVGDYVYKNDKINAVAYITNPADAPNAPVTISPNDQQITYTPFLKAATITENGYQLDYVYGGDYERAKSILQQNSNIIETKYYFGNYEKQIIGGTTREIHYVNGGDGICAIIVREGGVNNFNFVYSDYLGSLLTVTDINGSVIAEQNFDAWGRNRNATTWQYGSVAAVPSWLYRGYTGHEHLTQFALINMNGRLYDPAQGRMLSPDIYIKSPFGTQEYNRYSYAGNNPLIYTDPDGNIIVAILAGAAISAGIYSLQAIVHDNWNWHGFLKAAAMGAISGAIGGTIAEIGVALNYSATSLGLNIISNVGAQIGTNLAMGNDINVGSMAGAVLGGVVASGLGNFNGVEGSQFDNITQEIGFNATKFGVSGAVSGFIGAAINKQDLLVGAISGLENGALGGIAISTLNVMTMGPTYIPDRGNPEDLGDDAPVFRSGTFLTHRFFSGGGVTIGRNLVINKLKGSGSVIDDYNDFLEDHEFGHYLDILKLGFGKFYDKNALEYIKYGFKGSYSVPGTNEFSADVYSYFQNGYYFDESPLSHQLYRPPGTTNGYKTY